MGETSLVRHYPPQAFHGDVLHNTNYPPQSNNEGGSVPPFKTMLYESDGGEMQYENDAGEMLYEDSG